MNNNLIQEQSLSLPMQISELAKVLTFATVSILSFFVPFTLGHSQWLVGTIVNACLFLTAMYLPKKYFIPLAILPSLGVLARGLVFGPLTMFLVYFLPFIWLGNLILLYVFEYTTNLTGVRFRGYNLLYGVTGSAVGKFAFLFLVANIYYNFQIVPAIFLQTMGVFQLFTALSGGAIAFIILKSLKYGK